MRLHNLLELPWMAFYGIKSRGRSCTIDPAERLRRRNFTIPEAPPLTREPVSLSYDPIHHAAVPILAKLPIEIRRLIYTHALGNHLVHLLAVPRSITHFRCDMSSVADSQRCCHPRVRSSWEKATPSNSTLSVNILRTNRQVYAEALPVLYSSNIFDTNDLGAFNVFTNNIPPAGLSFIRSLYLEYWTEFLPLQDEITQDPTRAPYDDATNRRFWNIVTGDMPALREFRSLFATSWYFTDMVADLAFPWTQPIQRMRNLDFLEVALLEDITIPEDRQDQLEEVTAKLGATVCSERGKIVTRVLHP